MNQGEVQERREISAEAAAAYRARREALHTATLELEHELEVLEAESQPDVERLRGALDQLLATLREHIAQADAPDGLLADIIEAAPWFGPRAEQLRSEHAELLGTAKQLIDRAAVSEDAAALLGPARELSQRISEHRHEGTSLLLDAYMLDVPAAD